MIDSASRWMTHWVAVYLGTPQSATILGEASNTLEATSEVDTTLEIAGSEDAS